MIKPVTASVCLDSGHASGVQFDRCKCQCRCLLGRLEVNADDGCEWALEAFKYNHRMILINSDYTRGSSVLA